MIFICQKHGPTPASEVSPILYDKIMLGERVPIDAYIIIDYVFESERAATFYLDLNTARQHGFFESQTLPLPDEYPAFVKLIKPVCFKCLRYSLGV